MSLWPPAWQAELMGCSPASGETLLDRPSQPQVLLGKVIGEGCLCSLCSVWSLWGIQGFPSRGLLEEVLVCVCVCICACTVVITSVF